MSVVDINIKFFLWRLGLIFLYFVYYSFPVEGQQLPVNPFSTKVFSPFLLNPAMTGSRDYASLNLLATMPRSSPSQVISVDGRLMKKRAGYFSSGAVREFRHIGLGGYIFNDLHAGSGKIGAAASTAYHIPLNRKALSFLSVGASFKGVYSILKEEPMEDPPVPANSKTLFYNNIDMGVYYYGSKFFAGLAANNLLAKTEVSDSLIQFGLPANREYYLNTGYKFLLSQDLNIVLEPSVFITASDSGFQDIKHNIHPVLKLYMMDFCVGTCYTDASRFSFFFQYRYPRFFIGAYFDVPLKSAYYLKEPVIEIALSLNLSGEKEGTLSRSRW